MRNHRHDRRTQCVRMLVRQGRIAAVAAAAAAVAMFLELLVLLRLLRPLLLPLPLPPRPPWPRSQLWPPAQMRARTRTQKAKGTSLAHPEFVHT